MTKMAKEENFQKGLQLARFLKSNKPKGELRHHGFLITNYDLFVKSHCGVLENKLQFEKSYRIYKTVYMRAYDIMNQIKKTT